eukprot:UN15023
MFGITSHSAIAQIFPEESKSSNTTFRVKETQKKPGISAPLNYNKHSQKGVGKMIKKPKYTNSFSNDQNGAGKYIFRTTLP